MKKIAIITGVNGQDGSYLAEHLLSLDYKVYGLIRRVSNPNLSNISNILKDIELVESDITDLSSLTKLVKLARPHEYYNLAAQSHVGTSFEQPIATLEMTGKGCLHGLEAIRSSGYHTKFYQASTSEMFGGVSGEVLLNENTPFYPRSPYGAAKLYAHSITTNYRESYRMFACSGILFNHESPRRPASFVTRKITQGLAKIKRGRQTHISLGNLDSKRDWGHAKDYVVGMHLMLQQGTPEDFVLATGETHSIREFLDLACSYAGLNPAKVVQIDPNLYRPAEVDVLLGDASKARKMLGWKPAFTFKTLVEDMMEHDLSI